MTEPASNRLLAPNYRISVDGRDITPTIGGPKASGFREAN